jgi:hypothetical protein
MMKRWCSVVLLLAACAGCGGVGNVSGKVYLNDVPVPDGEVVFQQGNKNISASIKQDGSYEAAGVPSGTCKVAVLNPVKDVPGPPTKKGPKTDDNPKNKAAAAFKIPPQYANPEKSGLTVTVSKGETTPYDIKLMK